ncbi:uncharacterized protein [Canis lupus baileyi]|uniref:uncharacterized protein isoform X1 n=1 Tax=Canis lupus baileyi TaxID=143281 RepID=UPI003B97B3A3
MAPALPELHCGKPPGNHLHHPFPTPSANPRSVPGLPATGRFARLRWSPRIGSALRLRWSPPIGSALHLRWSPPIGSALHLRWSPRIGSALRLRWSPPIGSALRLRLLRDSRSPRRPAWNTRRGPFSGAPGGPWPSRGAAPSPSLPASCGPASSSVDAAARHHRGSGSALPRTACPSALRAGAWPSGACSLCLVFHAGVPAAVPAASLGSSSASCSRLDLAVTEIGSRGWPAAASPQRVGSPRAGVPVSAPAAPRPSLPPSRRWGRTQVPSSPSSAPSAPACSLAHSHGRRCPAPQRPGRASSCAPTPRRCARGHAARCRGCRGTDPPNASPGPVRAPRAWRPDASCSPVSKDIWRKTTQAERMALRQAELPPRYRCSTCRSSSGQVRSRDSPASSTRKRGQCPPTQQGLFPGPAIGLCGPALCHLQPHRRPSPPPRPSRVSTAAGHCPLPMSPEPGVGSPDSPAPTIVRTSGELPQEPGWCYRGSGEQPGPASHLPLQEPTPRPVLPQNLACCSLDTHYSGRRTNWEEGPSRLALGGASLPPSPGPVPRGGPSRCPPSPFIPCAE